MYRIDNDTASTTIPVPKPVGIPGYFTTGTVGGVPATIVEADFLNQVQEELMAILAAASISPSKATSNQVIQAILWLIANNTRQRLTGPLSLYVNGTTGSDTNNGLTPTTAFASPQRAWNFIMERLDVGGQNITVNVADGQYGWLTCAGSPVGASGGSSVAFVGDQVSPTSVVFSNPNGNAVAVWLGAIVSLSGIHIQAGGTGGDYNANGYGVIAVEGGYLYISNVDFGTCSGGHMLAIGGGGISTGGAPYSISGSAPVHANAEASGGGLSLADSTVTIYNTPTFSSMFMLANSCATANVWGMRFNGTAHGMRYSAQRNGVININGVNPETYFPGDIAGVVATGGWVI